MRRSAFALALITACSTTAAQADDTLRHAGLTLCTDHFKSMGAAHFAHQVVAKANGQLVLRFDGATADTVLVSSSLQAAYYRQELAEADEVVFVARVAKTYFLVFPDRATPDGTACDYKIMDVEPR